MKNYKVVAACAVFSVKSDDGRKEYALKRGDEVELPEDDMSVRVMLKRGQIIETVKKITAKK